MSYDFKIENGDIVPNKIVEGRDKLLQDMQLWFTEQFNTDRFHPLFGSKFQEQIGVANTDPDFLKVIVKAEIIRLIGSYQTMQAQKIARERWTYNAGQSVPENLPISKEELVNAVQNIDIKFIRDKVLVTVTLQTYTGKQVVLPLSIAIF